MNLIPVVGPFDIKVYGTQRGFINRPIEFILRNDNVLIEEIHIINPNGNYSSCDIAGKELDGHLSLEYQPEEIGTHEIKIFPNKMNRSVFSSFEFNIYDSSKLAIKPDASAIVGKVFKIKVDCLDTDGHGNLIASVEQGDRKLKSSIKRIKHANSSNIGSTTTDSSNLADSNLFEISFVPELESTCKVDIELVDSLENILYGDSIKIEPKTLDFQIVPYPLLPFHINTKCTFNVKLLREEQVKNVKLVIKQQNQASNLVQNQNNHLASSESSSVSSSSLTMEPIECHLKQLDNNYYECEFVPRSIERHFVEIYFDNQLINFDRPIKIDIFDVSKIRAKMPATISFGELNTFVVDTTGAGEGNLEVIIKDGFDTLKAQLLKREKRKFEIGFFCERNMKHDIQVIFNGIQIKDSPFYLLPELLASQSVETISEVNGGEEMGVIEGGPLDGLQCGEKMWIVVDSQTAPYYDTQFMVSDDNHYPIKHTKIQLEDGRWRIEFIPISVGLHQVQRLLQVQENSIKAQNVIKTNVLHYSAPRTVYGYKMYNLEDSVQLVFDAANFRVKDILPEVKDGENKNKSFLIISTHPNVQKIDTKFFSFDLKDPSDEIVDNLDCKYLSDYMALKFVPETTGNYSISFYDRNSLKPIASSPYKVIVHEDLREIIRSSGVYDLTRLTIASTNLPKDYELKHISVVVKDPQDLVIQNCFFSNKKLDLVVEFITRKEGVHKIFLYIKGDLVDDTPFFVYVNGDLFTHPTTGQSSSSSAVPLHPPFASWPHLRQPSQLISTATPATVPPPTQSSSSNDFGENSSARSLESNSADSLVQQAQPQSSCYLAGYGSGTIMCARKDSQFHFVITDKNIQGLCVYDPLNTPLTFKLTQDDHENGAVILVPKLEGAHKIVGLVEGRDFEAQLFVLNKPSYEDLFEMSNYSDENIIERPFVILLKEPNLEVDVYDPLGERVDVRYSGDNLATFIPRTTGYFKIYISDYHGPILGSPFYSLVNAQKDASTSELACVESSGIRDTVRNEEAKFIIRNKDLEIDVQIKNPQHVNLPLRKKRTAQGYLQVFYTPECIGPHEIHIFKDGVKVLGSPIVVFVSDPNEVKIENLEREAFVNKPFSFNIDANQAGEGFIRVNIKDPKLNDILPEITELSERKYLVSFLPKLSGIYEFLLTFNKYHIIESPFKVIARGGSDEALSTIVGPLTKTPVDLDSSSTGLEKRQLVDSVSNKLEEKKPPKPRGSGSASSPSSSSSSTSPRVTDEEPNSIDNELSRQPSTDPSKTAAAAAAAAAAIEYELNNWNLQLNNTLNKIMESNNTIVIGNKRTLSPITDTSEEESHDLNGPTFRGETFIENVERLPDGSSHLLLRIEDGDSNDLIDSNDPNRSCGKYKYRFKRIGVVGERWTAAHQEPVGTSGDNHQEVSKELVKSAIEKAIERVTAATSGDEDIEAAGSTTETESEFYTVVYTSQGLVRREASKTKHQHTENLKKKLKVTANQESTPKPITEASLDKYYVESRKSDVDESECETPRLSRGKTVAVRPVIEDSRTKSTREVRKRGHHSLGAVKKETPTTATEEKIKQASLSKSLAIGEDGVAAARRTTYAEKVGGGGARAHSVPIDEKFKPEESIQYEYEQVIEQPRDPKSNNSKVGKTREKFEKLDTSWTPNKVRRTTTNLASLISDVIGDKSGRNDGSRRGNEFSYKQKRPAKALSQERPSAKHDLARYKLNPDAEEFTPRNFVSLSAAKIDSSVSNDNLMDFYNLDPANIVEKGSKSMTSYHDLIKPVEMSSLQHGEQLKGDESLSVDDVTTCSRQTTRKSGLADDERDEDDSLAECEENYVITIKVAQEKPLSSVASALAATASPPVTTPAVAQPSGASPTDEKLYYKPIETLTTEEFFTSKSAPTEDNKSEQARPANQLSDLKAKFEAQPTHKDEKPVAPKPATSEPTIGKLPKSKVELYDNAEKNQPNKPTVKQSNTIEQIQPKPIKKPTSLSTQTLNQPPSEDPQRKPSTGDDDGSSGVTLGGVKSLLSKYEKQRSSSVTSSDAPASTTSGNNQSTSVSPTQSESPPPSITTVDAEPQQSNRPVKKLPPSIVQMFDRRDSGLGGSDGSLAPSSKNSSNSRLQKTASSSTAPYAKSDTLATTTSSNNDDSYLMDEGYFTPANMISNTATPQNVTVVASSFTTIIAEDSLSKSSTSSAVGKISKDIISQYEKNTSPEPSVVSIAAAVANSQKLQKQEPESEEPRKLPKSSFELYEPKSNSDMNKALKGRKDAPPKSQIETSPTSSSSPLSSSNIIYVNKPGDANSAFKTKQATIVLINSSQNDLDTSINADDLSTSSSAPLTDKGVKELVNRYEKTPRLASSLSVDAKPFEPVPKPVEPETPSQQPEQQAAETPRPKRPANESIPDAIAASTHQPASRKKSSSGDEENPIKKLISKYETNAAGEPVIEAAPKEVAQPVAEAPKKASPSPATVPTTRPPQTEPKEKEIAAGVKKLVDVYENKPQQTQPHQPIASVDLPSIISRLSSSGPVSDSSSPAPAVVPGKLPKSIYERYEPKRAESQPPDSTKAPEQPHAVYQPASVPQVRVFRSESSDLCAVLHIPTTNSVTNLPSQTTKKSPKIRCVLKVDSQEPLVYHISTASGRKVPFKVRHRNGKSIAVFGYHRVVDFNVAIESQTDVKPSSFKAELEIMVPDEYDFRIFRRDNYEVVPFDVSRDVVDNVYQITFEPTSTHNYIVKSKLKNDSAQSSRRRACKSEFRSSDMLEDTRGPTYELESMSRSRSHQNFKHADRFGSANSMFFDENGESRLSKTLSSQQISEIGNILEKTKQEIHRKLNDLKAAAIKVQLEVEYKDQLAFEVKKSDGQPVDFQPVQNSKDRHVIYFNYDSIVDFSIGVKGSSPEAETSSSNSSESENGRTKKVETLNAQIEVSVNGDYDFQIVKKDTQEPIDINVKPKMNNVYKIEFHPNPVTGYTLKANRRCSECLKGEKTDESRSLMNLSQLSQENDSKSFRTNVSVINSQEQTAHSDSNINVSRLHCKIFNPKNLEISEMPQSNNSISFIVNTQSAGRGHLKCHATDPDGEPVHLEYTQLDKFIYSVKINDQNSKAKRTSTSERAYLNLYLEYQTSNGLGNSKTNLLI